MVPTMAASGAASVATPIGTFAPDVALPRTISIRHAGTAKMPVDYEPLPVVSPLGTVHLLAPHARSVDGYPRTLCNKLFVRRVGWQRVTGEPTCTTCEAISRKQYGHTRRHVFQTRWDGLHLFFAYCPCGWSDDTPRWTVKQAKIAYREAHSLANRPA